MFAASAWIARTFGIGKTASNIITYVTLFTFLIGAIFLIKGSYDEARRKEGYARCQLEQVANQAKVDELVDDVLDRIDNAVTESRDEQRQQDALIREQYDDLLADKQAERQNFQRIIDGILREQTARGDATSDPLEGAVVITGCPSELMPIELRRYVRSDDPDAESDLEGSGEP